MVSGPGSAVGEEKRVLVGVRAVADVGVGGGGGEVNDDDRPGSIIS
jgi:hypothetical protein